MTEPFHQGYDAACPECRALDETCPKHKPFVLRGSCIRMVRLDPQGKPVGAPFTIHGSVTGRFDPFPETEGWIKTFFPDTYTMEINFKDIPADVMTLLYGGSLPKAKWWVRAWHWIRKAVRRG